jgi:hypothetical protein
MENIIKDLGLSINGEMEGLIEVTGDGDKLKELRTILDNRGYIDDSPMAPILSMMTGTELVAATETVTHILINTVAGNGYLALA